MQRTLVYVPILERALTALRYAAEEFEKLDELDDAAMMEERADELAVQIRVIEENRDV